MQIENISMLLFKNQQKLTSIQFQIDRKPIIKIIMNIEVEAEIEQNNENDSLFNLWKPNPNRKDQFGFDSAFFENYSVQNVSVDLGESLRSQRISNSNKSAINQQLNSHNADTISLTDMLKTNYCSHKGVGSSIGNITAFGKITNAERKNHNDRIDIQDDGLQKVSNRKLQNKANARRARERKKQEWQHMQEMIDELQIQNRTLKQNLESRGKSVNSNRNPEEGNKKKWIYCKRCKKDLSKQKQSQGDQDSSSQIQEQQNIFQRYGEHCKKNFNHDKNQYQLASQYRRLIYHNEQKKNTSNKAFFRSNTTEKNKSQRSVKDFESWVQSQKHRQQEMERQYLNYQKEHGNIDEEVRVFNEMNSKNRNNQYSKAPKNHSQMQLEFQQFDLSQTFKNQGNSKDKIYQKCYTRNQIKGKDKKKDRRWVGKMWLALSLIMLVIGVQLHGLQGSGQKSIRICDKQAKRWAADFEDPQRGELRIRMKTKIPTVQIENLKQTQNLKWKEKEKWKSNYQKIKNKQSKYSDNNNQRVNHHNIQNLNQDSQINSLNSLIQNISFESEQSYTRTILQQQEQEQIKFNKDFLYSIQAQFDDIGRYI